MARGGPAQAGPASPPRTGTAGMAGFSALNTITPTMAPSATTPAPDTPWSTPAGTENTPSSNPRGWRAPSGRPVIAA
jgi:hypothetical protein